MFREAGAVGDHLAKRARDSAGIGSILFFDSPTGETLDLLSADSVGYTTTRSVASPGVGETGIV